MIIDQLEKWNVYPFGTAWKEVFEFLQSLTPDAKEGKVELRGKEIYAIVSTYQTRMQEQCILETHRKYVDIQTLLSGRERIEAQPGEGLVIETAYDETKDVEFYKHTPGQTHIEMRPGTFALFFSQDAHMPGLMMSEEPELVKKVVVKIKADLLLAEE